MGGFLLMALSGELAAPLRHGNFLALLSVFNGSEGDGVLGKAVTVLLGARGMQSPCIHTGWCAAPGCGP
jgi:hypothetical protein